MTARAWDRDSIPAVNKVGKQETSMTAILGITDGDDGGAALVIDGKLVAAVNEERLNRMKMSIGFPRLAALRVLDIAGIR